MMKFREIFCFEIRYQLRQVSTWLLLALFLLFGFLMLRIVGLTDGTYLNAPGTIAFFTVFGIVLWVVAGGVVAGNAATRDIQARMHPLTFTAPVSKIDYLGARFLAALSLNAFILLLLFAGFLLSYYGPGAKTAFLGPFRLASYLTNYGFIALPAVLATTAIQFSMAALSRRAIAAYIASVLILLFSQFGGTTVRYMLDWKVLGSLMDLLGTSIAAEMEGWTPIEKNTRLILLEGIWLWNRLVWLCIAAGALAFAYFRFRLGHFSMQSGWLSFFRQRIVVRQAEQVTRKGFQGATPYPKLPDAVQVKRSFGLTTTLYQISAIAGASFKAIAGSRGGLTLVAALAIGTGLFAPEYMEWLGVPLFARTSEVLSVVAPSLNSLKTQWIIIPLLIIFYAGELIWRAREAGVNELTDTTPLPEWVMFLGKFLGLSLLIVTWVFFMMLAGIINQLVMQYYHFEIGLYLSALFGIQLVNYLIFALLIFAIHVLVNQKYIGHMVACCVYGFIIFAEVIGVEHKMLVYASDTGWLYSDMRGFGLSLQPLIWFNFYWFSWALVIGVFAILFWVRSRETDLRARTQLALGRLSALKPVLVGGLLLVIATGGFIFYNTNVLNSYLSKTDRLQMRVAYEKQYGKYEHLAQPVLVGTKLHVEIYPDKLSAHIKGIYQLVNRSRLGIDSIHVSTVPQLRISDVSFNRGAAAALIDENLGYRIYALKDPLAPGDSVEMSFEVGVGQRGFNNWGGDVSVAGNGSYISSDAWMPAIGYQDDRRLRNAQDRAMYGLPPRLVRPSLYDVAARYDARHAQQIQFEAVVGTQKGQLAVAPGALQRSWRDGDRHYYHYASNAPIHNDYAFFSARYAVREAKWMPAVAGAQPAAGVQSQTGAAGPVQQSRKNAAPVSIQIFYHPAHEANIGRMIKSVQASLAYYSKEFGPYPYSHFRVLERPGPARGMHAAPMTIDYQEGYSLMNPVPGGLDLPYHIMAHEVAHQWWGYYLSPAAVEGSGLLVESLATYSAMQVVEETLGYEHLLRYLKQMRQEYEVPRSRAAPPLLRANTAFMHYRKGPFALFALRNYIGTDRVNTALRQMISRYSANPPLPTTLDFYKELQAVTPDSLQYLLHDLFAANTFWDLKATSASATPTKAGAWQLTLEVEARKLSVDSMGVEKNISMDDWIEIGVDAQPAKGAASAKRIYLQKHRIHSGKQVIKLIVPEKPARAGIDPNHLLIDLKGEDNISSVDIIRTAKEGNSLN